MGRVRPGIRAGLAGWVLAGVVLGWIAVVFSFYYPEIARLVLHPLGLARDSQLEPLAEIRGVVGVDPRLVARAIWAIGGVAVLLVGAFALGARLLPLVRLSAGARPGDGLTATAVGLGVVAYVLFLLGLIGLLGKAAMVAIGLALLAHAAVWMVQRRRDIRRTMRAWQDRRTDNGILHTAHAAGVAASVVWLLAAAIIGAVCAIAFLGALAPEIEFDALWYHLELPALDLEAGQLVDRPEQYVSLYPQTAELLYAFGLGWQGVATAKLLHFAFGVLTAVATYRLGRRWLSPPFALAGAAILVATPLILWELRTAYVDLVVAFFVTVALHELLGWRETGDDRRLWRSAVTLGLALATKHVALLILPGALLYVALGRDRSIRESLRALLRWSGLRPLLGFAGLALLLASPWYLRSLVATGNPVFPELYSIFGAPADRWSDRTQQGLDAYLATSGFGRSPLELLILPWRATISPERFSGSIGPLYLITIPLALLLPRTRRLGLGRLALVPLVFLALWASPLSSFQLRFLIPILPVLAVLAAAGLEGAAERLRSLGRRWLAVCAAVIPLLVLVLALPPFLPWRSFDEIPNTWRDFDVGAAFSDESAKSYRERHLRDYGAIIVANADLPRDGRILSFVGGSDFYYPQELVPDYSAAAYPGTWALAAGEEAAAYAALRELGITHVLFDKRTATLPGYRMALTSGAFRDRYLTPVHEDANVELLALR